MKKELTAGIILAAVITLSIVNIGYVGRKIDTLKSDVDKIEALSDAEEIEQAYALLRESADLWMDFSTYAGVMLRHSDEISDVTDSYFAMLETLQEGQKVPPAMCEKLKHGLTDIAQTESLSLSSLF